MKRSLIFTIVLVIAAVALLVGFTTVHEKHTVANVAVANPSGSSGALALQNDFVSVVHKVLPSVVQIETSAGLGSGIVFDTKGDIVTNDHVVGSATSFKVTTSNGHQTTGKLVGTFADDDLAVIKIGASGLKPATFADSSRLEVGDLAIAVGNPLGLTSSVTEGIVSALNRSEQEDNGVTLVDTIQTSAAINPGNSGGALVDLYGRVIGIPTLAATDTELGTTASGIGFAIPSNVVTDIAGQIIKYGHVVNSHRPYLGIVPADTMGSAGVYVSNVTAGGPADKAGIKVGDVIVSLNGSSTATTSDLSTVEAKLKPGQKVKIKIAHQDGATATLTLTIGTYPGSTPTG
jgi:putative serine protease PepD